MILSMTGYANTTITLDLDSGTNVHVHLQLKTLNSRFFEASCRFPSAFSSLETEYSKRLKHELRRGQAYFSIHISDLSCFKTPISVSKPTLDGYLHAIDEIRKDYPIESTVTVSDLLRMQNLFIAQDAELTDNERKQLTDAVNNLIADLQEARSREGAQIKRDLNDRIAHMVKTIAQLEVVYGKHFDIKRADVQKQFDAIKSSNNDLADNQRALLYSMLDKMDLHEEITRFKGHLEHLQAIINSESTECGKKLDFTLQELAREVNTLASKCGNAEISNMAISLKVELEKCREQVQNVV